MDKIYQSYYTNSDYITNYMISKLELTNFDTVLEPSVGEYQVEKLSNLMIRLIKKYTE